MREIFLEDAGFRVSKRKMRGGKGEGDGDGEGSEWGKGGGVGYKFLKKSTKKIMCGASFSPPRSQIKTHLPYSMV